MSDWNYLNNLKPGKSGLKRNQFSRPQFLIFLIAFAIIGIVLIHSFALNPNLPGDLNNDNTVNITDMSILLSNYGTTNSAADINGDGTVNVVDLSSLLSHYGQSGSGGGPDLSTGFFVANSFWRQPIPSNATLSSSSQTWVNLLVNSTDNNTLYINHDYWTAAIYHANASTPKVTFSITNSGKHITIPYQSSWKTAPAPDTDKGMTIIDDSNGCVYEFQKFEPDISTVHAARVDNVLTGSGAHAADSGVSGGELPFIGGVITAQQAASGTIHHALRFAGSHNSPSYVAPGTRSDGTHAGGIPQGQLMRLDPNLNLSTMGLNSFQLMVAKALQTYGAYDSDSGGAFTVYVESTFDGSTYNNTSWQFPTSLTSHLQFVNFPFAQPTYDTNTSFSACSRPS